MELKKNKKYDLEGKFPLHLSIGLVLALVLVIAAFEWRGEYEPVDITVPQDRIDDPVLIYRTSIPPPPPPPKPKPAVKPTPPTPSHQVVTSDLPDELAKLLVIDIEPPEIPFDELPPEPVDPGPMVVVESMPEFPGGERAFLEYVSKSTKYPSTATRHHVEGTVYVEFIINEDGTLSHVKAIKGIGFGCDEAAVEVIKNSPKWTPGKQRGRPVKVRMVLPVHFKLGH